MNRIALRMDDVGASSKIFQQYGLSNFKFNNNKFRISSRLTNFLFFKTFPIWKGWGPYNELTPQEFESIFDFLSKNQIKMTIAITATWVDYDGNLIPYPEKFPEQSKLIKSAKEEGLLEIANHGLTHCVIGKHLPRLFSTNQKYHREFWNWIPSEVHYEHLKRSQMLLQKYFDCPITTFVPPGNVYTEETIKAASSVGIKIINCNTSSRKINNTWIIGNENIFDFHDRDITLYGIDWLETKIKEYSKREFCFIKDLTGNSQIGK